MKCIITHEIKTQDGFKVFEAGADYPAEEIGDRGKYFEKPSAKRAAKITEEVIGHDAG